MKVAFITPELEPLLRRTQIADLSHSLPSALRKAGADVRIFLPHSRGVDTAPLQGLSTIGQLTVADGELQQRFQVTRGQLGDLPVYLFGNDAFFQQRNPYGDEEGPYSDNWRRYALFSRAVLGSLPILDFAPDILHCLDWTTGLIPVLRELEYQKAKPEHPASRAGTYFQIHNLAMQGSFEREILPHIGLPLRVFQRVDGIELGGKVNFLKAGAEFATILCTHSPGHARRIQEQDRGYGLEETFRRRSKELVGIANGIDYKTWDPENDPLLAENFSTSDTSLRGKRKCKAMLQAMFKLDNGPRTPVAAMIGRFDADSGFDLVAEMLTPILERNVEVILMGAGRPDIQERIKTMEATFVGRCRVIDGYDVRSAHAIMGGSDLLFLPSHYNPGNALCAIGMRYGVVPIIYGASGLEDYVVNVETEPKEGTGFHFHSYSGDGLVEGIDAARKLYKDQDAWRDLVVRCLQQDFSWEGTAAEYLKAYRRVIRRVRPGKGSKKSA